MTIKTEQLKHSMEQLDKHLERLDEIPPETPHLSEPKFRGQMKEIANGTRDCIAIIFNILSEGQ